MTLLIWNLLRFNGQLPDEIIVKILYEFRGLEHPLVKKLLDFTENKSYENYQRSRISKVLEKMYREDGEVSDRMLKELNSYHGQARGYSLNMYINYTDPGYYMKRRFGKICYEMITKSNCQLSFYYPDKFNNYNGDYNSNYIPYIGRYWKLNRSLSILNKLSCKKCGVLINYFINSKLYPINFNKEGIMNGFYRDLQITYTELLKEIEEQYNIGHKTYSQCICLHCKEKSNDC